MKFNCDRCGDWRHARWKARILRLTDWHRWFAWYPVKVAHGDCRWLEPVERKFHLSCDGRLLWPQYRAVR